MAKKKVTPMMKQYNRMKEDNPGVMLLFRLGDFYEMFGEDAKTAARVLGITLTKRNHGGENDTPLAGFPHHALDRYAHKLVKAGHRIAVCEQVEDPKKAKGVVKRDIVELVSPGTGMDDMYLTESENNYIAALAFSSQERAGIAVCDITTGEFFALSCAYGDIEEEITRIAPAELLLPEAARKDSFFDDLTRYFSRGAITFEADRLFTAGESRRAVTQHFGVKSVEGLGLEHRPEECSAAGALLTYLKRMKRSDLRHIAELSIETDTGFARLDPATIRNLELLRPLHTDEKEGTLISVLDRCITPMGSRMLKRRVVTPLCDRTALEERYGAVDWFREDLFTRSDLQKSLRGMYDLERAITRVTLGRANARDILAVRDSLVQFPAIAGLLKDAPSRLIRIAAASLEGFEELTEKISATLQDDPPLSLREGRLIRAGVCAQLDEYRDAAENGKEWIARLQQTEREKTGIDSLKVGFNKVFGYYLEVSRANAEKVPDYFIRKQTLANAERFITPDLKEVEAKVLEAEDRMGDLEYELFVTLREDVAAYCGAVQNAADAVAEIDVFAALGDLAMEKNYCRPRLSENADLFIREGRHPVVEVMTSDSFVPNDTEFIDGERQIYIITGPNMAGKSTYLRQNSLIVLMAQIGSFVPAREAHIGLVDRFFTRVGASDRLAKGQSTFMVEMIEVANILNNATDRSLVLLDEVGRGTSTFDGISIAWAVAEFLHNTAGRRPRTLFATHYHELTELEALLPRAGNLHISVKEHEGRVIFMRKIKPGGCPHSYGIEVASIAGIPEAVIARSKEILANHEGMEFDSRRQPALARSSRKDSQVQEERESVQLDLFAASGNASLLAQRLEEMNIYSMTPLEAMNALAELKDIAQEDAPPQ
ncbi:MAG: DNA mismatch repair protein MutS [Fibrobacterota bacterium]